jgi:hypothetical protein
MSALDYLALGDLWHFIIAPFLAVLGSWFYAFLVLIAVSMVYLKSQNITLASIVAIFFCAAFITMLPPQSSIVFYGLLILAITIVLYKLFKG